MNIQPKPCANRRCVICQVVYREVGDTKIRLAHPRPVAYDGKYGDTKFKCPDHDEHGDRSET